MERRRMVNMPNLAAGVAIGVLLVSGGAYAAGQVTSAQIKNNTIKSVDVKDGKLTGTDIKNGSLVAADLAPGTIPAPGAPGPNSVTSAEIVDDTITAVDLGSNSVGSAEIQTDAVQASEIIDNSIDSGEIVDFGLSNQDVGVLFAQVNANGTLANSSGGVITDPIGTGVVEVDFGVNIASCAFIATQGEAGVGGAGGAITGVTDRSGNAEAVFATTRDDAGVLVNTAFQLVVVC